MIENQIPTAVIEYRVQANQSSFSQSLFRLYCLALQLEKVMDEMQERAKVIRANNTPSPQSK
ncbi:hypothetical protein Xsto_03925 [Xenorhabdus stockiae]|uniref:Uncharacterized protein n=1 Tax=Xenorhabdus stockiae TaxID=351614 RepID=A0A2D0KAP0_9GAMM|nr:hypothetical protein [Xenorhabdus stockiae]PHM60516.1 hypothetical protein Xsto_03925 [Xenorhabdus stockiae]